MANNLQNLSKSGVFNPNNLISQYTEHLFEMDEFGKQKNLELKKAQAIYKDYIKIGNNYEFQKLKQLQQSNKTSGQITARDQQSQLSYQKSQSNQDFVQQSIQSNNKDTIQESNRTGKSAVQQQQEEQEDKKQLFEKNIMFQTQKSFFNHRDNLMELVRSQHTYKILNELKYSPQKNQTQYPDLLYDGVKEVLKFNDEEYEIRDALLKQTSVKIEMLLSIREQLNRSFFKLFSCGLEDYTTMAQEITDLKEKLEEALVEQEDFQRKLESEKFFEGGNSQYQRENLPEFSTNQCSHLIIEKTYEKKLENFPYVTPAYLERFFNDFSNQHYCSRKIKKLRLINDYLPFKIQFQNIQYSEAANINVQIKQAHQLRDHYLLPSNLVEIMDLVSLYSQKCGIDEDINIDNGCLLLFQIDKNFPKLVAEQTEKYLQFHPYDVSSPFIQNIVMNKKKSKEKAEQLLKTVHKDNISSKTIKVRSSSGWIDKLQIISEKEIEQREQEAIFDQYEDTFVNGWLKFLLYSQQDMINTKIDKDMSVLEERANQISKEKLPDAYFEFYRRNLKLLFLNSRNSIIKLMSYLNYFRCIQKNTNLSYIELILGHSIEGQEVDKVKSRFDATKPLDRQELFTRNMPEDKFFLTNPCLAHYGNLSNFSYTTKIFNTTKEDYQKVDGEAKPQQMEEPNILYEEETIEFDVNNIINITDHNNIKIVYDSTIHDFFELVNEIGEICAFFFRFNTKHEQQEQGNKDIFRDNFDRETLIDSVLELESDFQFQKASLIKTLIEINKSTFNPELKQQLIQYIAKLMTKRPRMELFANQVFKCYHYEIQNLQLLNEILIEVVQDLQREEEKLLLVRKQVNPDAEDKLEEFYFEVQKSKVIKVSFYMKSIVKLILNIETSRHSFENLIFSSRSTPKRSISEILKCENDYFKQLLQYTKNIVYDCEGLNLFPDYQEFKFIELDTVLDKPENFDLIESQIKFNVLEKLTEKEREKFDFDTFSLLEFQKVRKKIMNFSYALTFLMDIYQQQLAIFGPEKVQQIESEYKISENQNSISDKANYSVGLLNLDKVKIYSEIKKLQDWMQKVTIKENIEDFIIPLEALINTKMMLHTCIVQNNIYFDQLKQNFGKPSLFQKKIETTGFQYFKNIFKIKQKYSALAAQTKIKQDKNYKDRIEKLGLISAIDNEEEKLLEKKRSELPYYSIKMERELQFESIKTQTMLQRINIERLSRKLPFTESFFEFEALSSSNNIQINNQFNANKQFNMQSDDDSDTEVLQGKSEFFDPLQNAKDIFSLPSIENIMSIRHEDFTYILNKYKQQTENDQDFLPLPEYLQKLSYKYKQNNQNEEQVSGFNTESLWNSQNQVGGSEWYKKQQLKQDRGECLWQPNKNSSLGKTMKNQKGFKVKETFKTKKLLYLKKTTLYTLWKLQNNLMNIITQQIFLVSLEANNMDILFLHNGLLSSADLKIGSDDPPSNSSGKKNQFTGMLKKKQQAKIPILKRNELRLRRDLESLQKLINDLKTNIKWIRSQTEKITNTDEAITCYLDKVENRLFLTILYVLMEQMKISRLKSDNEFVHCLRYMIINLNFNQVKQMAKQEKQDNHVLMKKNLPLEEEDQDSFFPNTPDRVLFEHESEYMKMIKMVFWDNRPKLNSSMHSTNMRLFPTNYFFQENLKLCHILDKSLVGIPQSRTTELSTTYAQIKQMQNDFLRSIFVFEKDDIFKYERMYTKIVNLNVRLHIAREIFYVRELKIYPFEVLEYQNDPLQEKINIWKKKLNDKLDQDKQQDQMLQITSQANTQQQSKAEQIQSKVANFNNSEKTLQELCIVIFEINKQLIQESVDYYHVKNVNFAKYFEDQKALGSSDGTLANINWDPLSIVPNNFTPSITSHTQQDINNNLVQLDLVSIISTFCNKIHFNSIEIKTLKQEHALVISKPEIKKHLSELNYDLIKLMDNKYKQKILNLQQKAEILEKDVVFEKKEHVLMEKKINFLEQNTQNLVEALVAQKTNELQFELQSYKSQLAKYEREEGVREQKLRDKIKLDFINEIKDQELKYNQLLKSFNDFKIILGNDVNHYIMKVKNENFLKLKDVVQTTIEEHQTGSNALHDINNDTADNLNLIKKFEENHGEYMQEFEQRKLDFKTTKQLENDKLKIYEKLHKIQTEQQKQIQNNNKEFQQQLLLQNQENAQQQSIQPSEQQQHSNQNNNDNNNNFLITQDPQQGQQYQQQTDYWYGKPDDPYFKLNLQERILLENNEFKELFEKFNKLRYYFIYREAKLRHKYEQQIKKIKDQNTSNEELFRKIQELQTQNEIMSQELIQTKKTMSIMEYQNEILRRDVQRGNKMKIKLYKQKQEIELELEQQNIANQQFSQNLQVQQTLNKRNSQQNILQNQFNQQLNNATTPLPKSQNNNTSMPSLLYQNQTTKNQNSNNLTQTTTTKHPNYSSNFGQSQPKQSQNLQTLYQNQNLINNPNINHTETESFNNNNFGNSQISQQQVFIRPDTAQTTKPRNIQRPTTAATNRKTNQRAQSSKTNYHKNGQKSEGNLNIKNMKTYQNQKNVSLKSTYKVQQSQMSEYMEFPEKNMNQNNNY